MSTVDFFMPIVDDARTWGRIAATNAASDVYAMGGQPLFALNLVAWPREHLSLDLLGEVLAGAAEAAAGRWVIAGGHSVDGAEPMFGQAVTGEVDEARLVTNAGGRAGDALVLTKPIGTGVVATAVKRLRPGAVHEHGEIAEPYAAAVHEMTRHNDEAAAAMIAAGAHAATDVTGFGLLGHLHTLALASGVAVIVDAAAVPLLPGAVALAAAGYVPGGTDRNLDWARPVVDAGATPATLLTLLADAQTSGGLLFACDPVAADEAVARLRAHGHAAARIGALVAGAAGHIALR